MKQTFFIGLALAGFLGSRVHADPPTLVILPFDNATGSPERDGLRQGIPDLVAAFLAPFEDRVHVVDREHLETLMAEQGLRWENLTTRSPSQIGQLAQARYLVRGSVLEPKPGRLLVQAALYDTETTQQLKSLEQSGARGELNGLMEQFSNELVVAMGLSASSSAQHKPLPVDPDPEVNVKLIQGLGYYHQGQYEKAIPEFMKILAIHPDHASAKSWLIKSYQSAGLDAHAELEARL